MATFGRHNSAGYGMETIASCPFNTDIHINLLLIYIICINS
ncbi:hypothetical protein HMPREF0673_00707 [Leyella stercorea DSM 18206]|uniref:Uncharacterized protein n=1 Tax=Leyella stercorea DSM 18206 TaxID=1002367 RepID=G6AVR8_9BACT|nr:hypothetical protein HMPREF0673_00707 [Leyella stercorea DSM 18206]